MKFIQNLWYAAGWSQLQGDGLTSRTIAGEYIVFYRTKNGPIAALSDTCPHRFAPLHRGKRVGDSIECGYHGLRFSAQGACVYNPHGPVPKVAKLKTYPVVEKDGLIWVWVGDAERADPATIVQFPWLNDPAYSFTAPHTLAMPLACELIVDNLLDLSHAAYLHPATLGAAQGTKDVVSVHKTGNRIQSNRLIPNSHPAFVFVATGAAEPEDHVDYWANMRWDPPGSFYMDAGIVTAGGDRSQGRILSSVQIVTPSTETSSYYHWKMFRNYALGNEAITGAIQVAVMQAFNTEDEPMISAVQSRMAGREFWSMTPILLSSDSAAVQARRVVAALTGDAPTNPLLTNEATG